jgi:chemotaxis protein CheC
MTFSQLQEAELKALTEVCAAGMRHAATALSQLLGKPVSIEVPRLLALTPGSGAQLLSGEVTCLHLQINGEVGGSIVILLQQENTRRVLEYLLGQPPAPHQPLSDLEISTLKEVGNILASACLNALGSRLNTALLPSVPYLESGSSAAVLAQALEHFPAGESILLIDTLFTIGVEPCTGSILLAPASASLELILAQLAPQ